MDDGLTASVEQRLAAVQAVMQALEFIHGS